MANLTQVRDRLTTQDRVTRNRDSIVPDRRDTRTDARQVNADMRAARRGDGAETLRQIFGAVDNLSDSFGAYAARKGKAQEAANASKAQLDAALNRADPQMMEKSKAYRSSYTTAVSMESVLKSSTDLKATVEEALNDPENPAGPEDIERLIQDHLGAFALEDGKVKDFGSPEANEAVAGVLLKTSAEVRAYADGKIREQVEDRAINATVFAQTTAAAQGEPLNFEAAFKTFVPGTDLKKAKKALLVGYTDLANSLAEKEPTKALGIMDQILNSKRSDGTPSLNPEELAATREARDQLEREIERAADKAQKERYEANQETLLEAFVSGRPPSIAAIREMERNDKIPADTALTLINRVESEARERRAEARAAQSAARESYRDRVELGISSRVIDWQNGLGPTDAAQFGAELRRMQARGELGEGTQAAANMLQLNAAWKAGRESIRQQPTYKAFAKKIADNFKGLPGAKNSDATLQQAAALEEFRDNVLSKKMSPASAYSAAMRNHGKAKAVTAADLQRELAEMEARRNNK